MNYKKRNLVWAALFLGCNVFAQEVLYWKGDKQTSENEYWTKKLVQTKSSSKGNETLKMEWFDRDDVLRSKTVISVSSDKKNSRMSVEDIYAEEQCKTVQETVVKNEVETSTSKCLDLEGKVIDPNEGCLIEKGQVIGGAFHEWLKGEMANFFPDNERPINYMVQFTVKPNYEIVVQKINLKYVDDNSVQLDATEQRIVAVVKRIPARYLEGTLRKINGKIASTQFNLPVIYKGSDY